MRLACIEPDVFMCKSLLRTILTTHGTGTLLTVFGVFR